MKNKKIGWSIAGAAVLLLALTIVIISNKETPEVTMDPSPVIQNAETDEKTVTPEESEIQPDTGEEYSQPEPTEQPVLPSEEPEKEPSIEQPDTDSAEPNDPALEPTAPQQTKPETMKPITDGTYEIGTDIEAGEYLVFSNGITLLENTTDLSGNADSIVFNVALDGRSHTYVTLLQGKYFTLDGGEMYPVAGAPDLTPVNGVYEDGQYKIGKDLPAGTYTLQVNDQSDIGFYEISTNSRQDMMDMLVSDVVEGETPVDVADSQYLTIRNAYIEVK